MTPREKKAAIAAYKERKVIGGIYAVRCLASGRRWIGWACNLATIQNRLWFALRLGTSPHRTLQAAWNASGAASFVLEEVERLDDEALAFVRDRVAKERHAHWCATFGAEAI
ncbi:MAG: GIY-YIG nuclease family protein [Reyranella sp.]|uniref:GIY-YIG nuclease family protein n=1 Tax=Reyranella sp. TaxID=1929291 RepID=UPI003D11F23F